MEDIYQNEMADMRKCIGNYEIVYVGQCIPCNEREGAYQFFWRRRCVPVKMPFSTHAWRERDLKDKMVNKIRCKQTKHLNGPQAYYHHDL